MQGMKKNLAQQFKGIDRRTRLWRHLALLGMTLVAGARADDLASGWNDPPRDARLRAYWWWLNGNVTKAAITRDLEQMQAKGFGGALICDADGSSQAGNTRVPHGPTFGSPEWRELFKHTLREAKRLNLEMSLNIQSGWNLGGPMVPVEDAPKKLLWTETRVTATNKFSGRLESPQVRGGFYHDLFVLAFRTPPNRPAEIPPLRNLAQKALRASLVPFSAPDSSPLFEEAAAVPNETDAAAQEVLDLTGKFGPDELLHWEVPPGDWQVLRFGYTLNDHCRVSTCSEGWDGYAVDPFDAGAFERYWNAAVAPLLADAASFVGNTLKYLHTDSWEVEVANWTPTLREEFQRRRGYELLPWLPVLAGKIINSREESNRFLNDFRRTMGDLAIAHHFQPFKEAARRQGLQIHPESGGPHSVPIDAQQCLGFDDAPMSEFWAWSWEHRIGDANRFFVKQPASAAHTYGHKLVLAEGFTSIGPHWQESLWDNLKPAFDYACTEGLNLLVWHAFVCSPASEGLPGQQYFAGTHLNPNVTWWDKSAPLFAYFNRCQFLLQRGLPVCDVAYYYGNHVPNFAQYRVTDPARVGPGYDHDVLTEEVLLHRVSVHNGRLVLPEGTSYRVLVLPNRDIISLPVLRQLQVFVKAGATIIGPKPARAISRLGYPQCDVEVRQLADALWNPMPGANQVLAQQTSRAVLEASGVGADFAAVRIFATPSGSLATTPMLPPEMNYIHRRDGAAEIYFVANRTNLAVSTRCSFRVKGKAPELWNPITGAHAFASAYTEDPAGTTVPLDFSPCGSWFVIFRDPAAQHPATAPANAPTPELALEFPAAWTVRFDPNWGGPETVAFGRLESWTDRPEPGIKYYSGTAQYQQQLELPTKWLGPTKSRVWLDLGVVHEIAEVRVNGQSCGIVWAPPFRVDVTKAVRPGPNDLEISVVNFWPNRIIGDASLPQAQRRTKTNIRKLTASTPLMPSGLLGPVRLLTE